MADFLGGDRPLDMAYDKSRDSFKHAVDLVKFIRRFNECGVHSDHRGFGIGVAGFPEGHPATPNRLTEMEHFKEKVDAGAGGRLVGRGDQAADAVFLMNRP